MVRLLLIGQLIPALLCFNADASSKIIVHVYVKDEGLSKDVFLERYSNKIERYLVKTRSGELLSSFDDLRSVSDQTLEAFPGGGVRIRLQVQNDPGILRKLAGQLKSMGLPKGSVMTYSRLDQWTRIVF